MIDLAMRRSLIRLLALALPLGGCASTQLNVNTLDLASSTASLQAAQVLSNIDRFIAADADGDYDALPSQVLINSGSLQTTNSLTPNLSNSLSKTTQVTTAATTTNQVSHALARVLSGQTTDQWTQSWSIAPVNDGNALRRLRALYRYAAGGTRERFNRDYLPMVMPNPHPTGPDNLTIVDPSIGTSDYDKGVPNSGALCLRVYRQHSPDAVEAQATHSLKAFGRPDLFVSEAVLKKGCLSSFIILVQDASGATASAAGGPAGKKPALMDQILLAPSVPAVALQ